MGRGSPALQARYGEFQRMGLPLEKEERCGSAFRSTHDALRVSFYLVLFRFILFILFYF